MKNMNFKHSKLINHICFTDDGNHLISLTEEKIHLWNLKTKQEIYKVGLDKELQGNYTKIFRTSTKNIYCLLITEWNETIYSFYQIIDNKILLLGKIKTDFEGFNYSFQVINNQIILANKKGWSIYSLSNFTKISNHQNSTNNKSVDVAINQKGTKIVFLNFKEKCMYLYSTLDGTFIRKIENKKAYFNEGDCTSISFREGTNEIYTYRKFGDCVSYNIWDMDSGKLIENEKALDYTFGNNLKNMQISEDGKYLWMNFKSAKNGVQILCWKLKKRNKETLWKLDEIPNNSKIDFCPVTNNLALNVEKEIILLKKNNIDSFFNSLA